MYSSFVFQILQELIEGENSAHTLHRYAKYIQKSEENHHDLIWTVTIKSPSHTGPRSNSIFQIFTWCTGTFFITK